METFENVENYYVGFKTESIPNWKTILPVPTPPRNYKNPETIKKWEEEKLAQLAQEAPNRPFSGKVTHIAILNDQAEYNFFGSVEDGYEELTKIINSSNKTILWGLDIKNKVHLAALTLAQIKSLKRTWGLFAKNLSIQLSAKILLLDPVQVLFGTSGPFEFKTLCKFLDEETISTFELPGDSAEQRAKFVKFLVNRFNLNEKLI